MERVNLVYASADEDEIELPFRLLVLGNFSLPASPPPLETLELASITPATFDSVLSRRNVRIQIRLANHLVDQKGYSLDVDIPIKRLEDFHPDAILNAVPEMRNMLDLKKRLSSFKQNGLHLLDFDQLTDAEKKLYTKLIKTGQESAQELDLVIADILDRLGRQLNEILNHEIFRHLESSWKGLHLLVSDLKNGENCTIDILDIRQEELEEDFEASATIFETVLYKKMYMEEFGQFGGKPYGALILNYKIGKTTRHFALLKNLGQLAELCHTPAVAQVDASFFGLSGFSELPRLRDLRSTLETHRKYSRWRTLRKSEEARYLGLVLPEFLLRYPYDYRTDDIASFSFIEEGEPLWGNAVFAFASCLMNSFVKHRLCLDIVGPQGGHVAFLDRIKASNPNIVDPHVHARILVSERTEEMLTNAGFISLVSHKAEEKSVFHAACSIKQWNPPRSKKKKIDLNALLSSQLPYTFLVSRVAHYIKVIQRDRIGSWQNAQQLEEELNIWLRQYVSEMENPSQEVVSKRPLRFANVSVTDHSSADWFDMNLELIPHLRFMGANFSLSLQGILDRRSTSRKS